MSNSNPAIGTATLATPDEAREHYAAGGIVLVHEGSEPTLPVTSTTTTHSRNHGVTSWSELEEQIKFWSNRYTNQNYYIVALGKK